MAIEEIYNFVALSADLATAGQPTAAQLEAIAQDGYTVVINLDVPDSRYALPNEPALVQELGMVYHNIPVDFGAPTLADFVHFTETMDSHRGQKIFVHCAANYRVSTFTALYGQTRWEWSQAQADAHIERLWAPNRAWSEFIHEVRRTLDLGSSAPPDEV